MQVECENFACILCRMGSSWRGGGLGCYGRTTLAAALEQTVGDQGEGEYGASD